MIAALKPQYFDFFIKIINPSYMDLVYSKMLLTTFKHRDYIAKKLKSNMEIVE